MNTSIHTLLLSLVLACAWLPGFVLGAAVDPKLAQAIRNGERAAVHAILAGGAAVNAHDESGNTPLMSAALLADTDMVKLLLKAGAEVNAANQAGATPLMRAATDDAKVRLLVESGAKINARSGLGNTTLMMAARPYGSGRTVKFLLEHGAEVNATNIFGATALMAAVAGEDEETVRLLLDAHADVNLRPVMNGDGFIMGGGRTALMWAAFRGNETLIKLLLARGAKVNEFTLIGSALTQAAWAGNARAARALLEAGAQIDQRDLVANYTPLHWAASSERADATLVNLLLARGADANAEGGQPVDGFLGVAQTPLKLARKRGETPIVKALLTAGARDLPVHEEKRLPKLARSQADLSDPALVAAAIRLAVGPLQKTAVESPGIFQKHASKQDCISCHQQDLPLAAISLARSRHIPVDEPTLGKQAEAVERFATHFEEVDLQTTFHPEPAIGNGYALFSLHLEGQPASARTDSHVQQLAVIQNRDGHWAWNLPRPPIQSSDIGATALAIQALRSYAIPGRQRELEQRVQRARAWLSKARPEFNEERVYQLLGLAWAGQSSGKLKKLAEELVRDQRADGGWGQLPALSSDAFATGQALYALTEAAALSAHHPAVKSGIRFLLKTQLADGTWHARRRTFPFQPPMQSGFPHGADSWLSAAATSWAVMALASTLDPRPAAVDKIAATKAGAAASQGTTEPGLVVAVTSGQGEGPVSFVSDIKPLLERSCVACHSGERPKASYHMGSREGFLKGGNRGEAAVVPGQTDRSVLLHLVSDQVEDLEMPPLAKRDKFPPLSKEEVARLQAWIAQGAVWPEGVSLAAPNQRK